jgi:phosphoribosyl 1,2-cyclic phosphodiesterase
VNLRFLPLPSTLPVDDDPLLVKFWGVRGSYPAPGKETLRYGGNTSCVAVHAAGHTIILDAGTGIIPLGRALARRAQQTGRPVVATLLFSHTHHDHIQGFPFFTPAYASSTRLSIFGPQIVGWGPGQSLGATMALPFFPVAFQQLEASRTIGDLHSDQVLIWRVQEAGPAICPAGSAVEKALRAAGPSGRKEETVCARLLWSDTHPGGVLFYRIEWRGRSVVYASDTEGRAGIDPQLVAFARGADLLIHDAQYTPQHYHGQLPGMASTRGWGHSTVDMACATARAAQVKALALFHHEPGYPDETIDRLEMAAQSQFPGAFAAYEGLEMCIGQEVTLSLSEALLWQDRQAAGQPVG